MAERVRKPYPPPSVRGPMPESKPPATYIADLRPSCVATIEATVASLEPTREIATRDGGTKKVRNGKLKDATGEISLVLWGTEVDLVSAGDHITIVEGWVSEYRGQPQVSLGRTGKIERRTAPT